MNTLKKIPANNLMPGCHYGMAFYGDENNIRECKLLARPEHQIYAMEPGETFDIECEGEIIHFRRNRSAPHYLITDRKISGAYKQTRVIFYRLGEKAPVTISAKNVEVK